MSSVFANIKQGLTEAIEYAAGQPSQTVVHPPKTTETMAIPNPTVKFTYEDYLNAPEDKRYELLDGDLVPIPTPGELHQNISILLGWKLVQFASENSLGRVYLAPFDVVLSDIDVVQPDLLFVSNVRNHIITPRTFRARQTWSSKSYPPPQPNATGRSSVLCMPSTA
jgi:hypothetical protein